MSSTGSRQLEGGLGAGLSGFEPGFSARPVARAARLGGAGAQGGAEAACADAAAAAASITSRFLIVGGKPDHLIEFILFIMLSTIVEAPYLFRMNS